MARDQGPEGHLRHPARGCAARASVFERRGGDLRRAGYGRIETPAFEETELFARGVGEATDIVHKEMFTFDDQGGRELTLRPEGTAPICRAYVEHGMHKLPQPVKLWYSGPFFRHERPQAGRFRQFHQIGAEAIGTESPLADAEMIVLLDDLLRGLGVPGVRSCGSAASARLAARAAYREELREYLRAHEDELSDGGPRADRHQPAARLRLRSRGHPGGDGRGAALLDRLDDDDAEHFEAVRALLDAAGVAYELDGTLVRGLDYYTRTVFEFTCDELGAQSALGGGGRYDGLIAQLGGPATPAVGWAAGIERILLALDAESPPRRDSTSSSSPPRPTRERAFALVGELRRAGPLGRARPRRALGEGADEAGRPRRRRPRADPRRRRRRRLRDMSAGEQRDARPRGRARRDPRHQAPPQRTMTRTRDRASGRVPGAAARTLPRHLVRPGARRPGRRRGPRRRLGPPPPRPRRADLHRPARPHRPRPARLRPRRVRRGPRARPQAARRGRAQRRAARSSSARRRRSTPRCRRARSRSASARRRCSPTPRRRRSRSRASPARSARRRACATATSTCAASGCARRSSCATG